ncbi:MAG: RnfABCDGE type electron transport complex subunit D [Eubacterium sp.]|jgi:electron transport complex protein RnfD|nr:RnfABCDGE type electron transport complex subunit D [Eubacterium sp.]
MSSQLEEKIDSFDDQQLKGMAGLISARKARHIYADQIMCFAALTGMAFWRNGPRALYLVLTSVIVSILVDFICCKMSKKEYTFRDFSNIAAGMCIALMTPANIPYGMIAAGAGLAIGIKHIFGGKDNYIFNPTAVTLAFLIICYPEKMLYYPAVGEWLQAFGEVSVPLTTGLESILIKLGRVQELSLSDIMLGNFAGPMGTTHIAVIAVSAVCLSARRAISAIMTSTGLAVILIIATIFPIYDNFGSTLAYEIVGGYMLFGLIFLANDPQTVPKTQLGKVFYGVVLGIMTVIFRRYGKVEGSFVFALLASNAISFKIDAVAEKSIEMVFRIIAFLRRSISTYENFSETAKTLDGKELEHTREIEVLSTNYDMPPIDGKVTKINRKKPNLLKKAREKIGDLTNKAEDISILGGASLPEGEIELKLEFKKMAKLIVEAVISVIRKIAEPFKAEETAGDTQTEVKPERTAQEKELHDTHSQVLVEVVDFEEVAEITGENDDNL